MEPAVIYSVAACCVPLLFVVVDNHEVGMEL
jgi:hypothetical protein